MTPQESLTKRRPEGVTDGDFYDIPFEIMQLEKDIEEELDAIIKKRERLKYLKSLTLIP